MKLQIFQRQNHGFSLIEVSVALGIFAFAIVVILGLMGAALKGTQDSEERIQAANVATILLERYQELLQSKASSIGSWDAQFPISDGANTSTFQDAGKVDNLGRKTTDRDKAVYRVEYTSEPVVVSGATNLVRCSVKLSWPAAAPGTAASNSYTATTAYLIVP